MSGSVLQDWAAALRRRADQQITGALAKDIPGRGRCFCALGVLYDEKISSEAWAFDVEYGALMIECITSLDYASNATGVDVKTMLRVVSWNDSVKLTFDEIADKLEKLA